MRPEGFQILAKPYSSGLVLHCAKPLFFAPDFAITWQRSIADVVHRPRSTKAGARKYGSISVIRLDYRAPPVDLRPYISVYYLFETDEPEFADIERADVAQVRAFLSGKGEVIFPDAKRWASYPVTLFGPRSTASTVTVRGPARVFGVGILPAGWSAFTGLAASDRVNTLSDATDLLGPGTQAVLAGLAQLANIDAMAEMMTAIARQYKDRAQSVPHWFIRAVDSWLEERLSPDIVDLEAATGLSRRQIERMTKQIYGVAPKLLQRKYRALRTANRIANEQGDWQDFIDGAYYDQSHCIREIKHFVGITPGAIREHSSRLSTLTFGRSQLAGEVAPLSAQT